jgi:hypothetical protein
MNAAIEMHDSECLAVEVDGQGSGFVLLDAYVHRTEGDPVISPGEGGIQRVRIKVGSAAVEGDIGPLPATIYEGSLVVGNSTQDNIVPFPASYAEEFQLKMMLSDDARVVVVFWNRTLHRGRK